MTRDSRHLYAQHNKSRRETIEEMRRLAAKGVLFNEIAVLVGRSGSTVDRVCKDLRGESNRGKKSSGYDNTWLPEGDEDRNETCWIPKPHEIAQRAAEIRGRNTGGRFIGNTIIDTEDERYGDDWFDG